MDSKQTKHGLQLCHLHFLDVFAPHPQVFAPAFCHCDDIVLCTAGVLDLKNAQEWVVTTKLGSSDKRPGTQAPVVTRDCRMYAGEMMMSCFVLTAAFYGIFSVNKWSFSIFLTLQGDWCPDKLFFGA